ncbi:MAG: DUF5658 family protein [Armatimonadota bacterium]|nr:DUF5658 family protein [bacterium]MDW8289698.1 DUF5658 family protein [Armatimonadota bacterium]
MKGYISRESWVIAAICVADLVSTLIFVHHYGAREGNPLMDYYLQLGVVPFILAKCVMFLFPIAIIEWARRHNPEFVQRMARFAIAAYIGLYLVVVAKENILSLKPAPTLPPAALGMYGTNPYVGPMPEPPLHIHPKDWAQIKASQLAR